MNYRNLGRFGLKVSEVGIGGWLTHGRSLDDAATTQIVHKAFDLGINFFDTADVYTAGKAELALGVALKGIKREDVVVATKCYFPMSDRPNDRGLSRKHIVESLNSSLKRLNLDYVDIMQFHRFDATVPLDETVRAIDDLVRQGKTLYWGTSDWPAHKIAEVVMLTKELGCHPPISNQPQYNMLSKSIEQAVLPCCEGFGIGQVVYSPLAQGVLTGKYEPGKPIPADSRAADDKSNQFMGDSLGEERLVRVQKLKGFAERHGHDLTTFALAWCLRKPIVSSVIVGATKIAQVEHNAAASGVKLDASVWGEADRIAAGEA